jgi:hypothetical protein
MNVRKEGFNYLLKPNFLTRDFLRIGTRVTGESLCKREGWINPIRLRKRRHEWYLEDVG